LVFAQAPNRPAVKPTKTSQVPYPPLPILPPTALTGDAGDGRAYLRWNLQLEDERVTGWEVLQLAPSRVLLTPVPIREDPAYVVHSLKNGTAYTFAVVGVLKNSTLTPQSNTVTVVPRRTSEARVLNVSGQVLAFGDFADIALKRPAVRITFPDGQELTYSNCRPVDWKTRDGEHLLCPKPFGNGVDIGQFDNRGLPKIIPPDGLRDPSAPGGVYRDVQYGVPHPHIGDPLTLPFDQTPRDAGMRWQEPIVDGDRVILEYWIPLSAWGYSARTYVRVWETWWPIERDRHGAAYHGLARQVEVEMPSALKYGYQVMLNNGFGPSGKRDGVVSYSTGFRNPAHQVVDFSGNENRYVTFQDPKMPRSANGYHPTQDCLQASPMIFYDWGKGSLTISARGLYYHVANNSASYPEQGTDGVWPNLAWDMAIAGKRTPVDTVEYLYTADTRQPLPQRYVNARFEIYGDVSERMGVQNALATVAKTEERLNHDETAVAQMVDRYVKQLPETGIRGVGLLAYFWYHAPYAIDSRYLTDPSYGVNPFIKLQADRLAEAGLQPGSFFRPELARVSIPTLLSTKMPDARYDWFFAGVQCPPLTKLLEERGIPILRQHTNWIRRQRDGSWPINTQYQSAVMSMAGGWWDQMMWPALWMSKKLGYTWSELWGDFAGMSGVDYTLMLDHKTDGAVAFQPYWWRMFRSMHYLGIKVQGECTQGWRGADVSAVGAGDDLFLWMFNQGLVDSRYYGDGPLTLPRNAHRLYQLYNMTRHTMEQALPAAAGSHYAGGDAVRRYATKFYAEHRPPDRIEFRDLRASETKEMTFSLRATPLSPQSSRGGESDLHEKVTTWSWTDVVWHYKDGTSAVYPAFDKIDWSKQ
jgi:hypothetical protein